MVSAARAGAALVVPLGAAPRCIELQRRQYVKGGAGLGEEVGQGLGKLSAMVRPEPRIEILVHLMVPFRRFGFVVCRHARNLAERARNLQLKLEVRS